MSRNRYAVILLVVLALTLWLAGRYVNRTTATLCNELQTACTLAETRPNAAGTAKLTERLRITLPRPARCWGCWCGAISSTR